MTSSKGYSLQIPEQVFAKDERLALTQALARFATASMQYAWERLEDGGDQIERAREGLREGMQAVDTLQEAISMCDSIDTVPIAITTCGNYVTIVILRHGELLWIGANGTFVRSSAAGLFCAVTAFSAIAKSAVAWGEGATLSVKGWGLSAGPDTDEVTIAPEGARAKVFSLRSLLRVVELLPNFCGWAQ